MADWDFSTLAELGEQNISAGDVGRTAWVEQVSTRYQAIRPGRGLACWDSIGGAASQGESGSSDGSLVALQRTFAFDEEDLDVAALEAVIDLGEPLPDGAYIVGMYAEVTDAWEAGDGAFTATLSIQDDANAWFTPMTLDDEGKYQTSVMLAASGAQLLVTFEGDENLSTLTAGALVVHVLYAVPQIMVVGPAPLA